MLGDEALWITKLDPRKGHQTKIKKIVQGKVSWNYQSSLHHAACVNRSRLADCHWHAESLQAIESLGLVVHNAAIGVVAIIWRWNGFIGGSVERPRNVCGLGCRRCLLERAELVFARVLFLLFSRKIERAFAPIFPAVSTLVPSEMRVRISSSQLRFWFGGQKASVFVNLLCKIVRSRECFTAVRTDVGFLLRVCSHVSLSNVSVCVWFKGPGISRSPLTSSSARDA